jgi:peptidyl-prolyl cis-trans isomerase SurA
MKILHTLKLGLVAIIISYSSIKTVHGVGISAVVADTPITTAELDKRFSLFLILNNIDPSSEAGREMRQQILNSIVDEKIIEIAASKNNIEVSESEIDQAAQGFCNNNQITYNDFKNILESKKLNDSIFRDFIKSEITRSKFIRNRIIADKIIKVSEPEIKEQFEMMKKYQKDNVDAKLKLAEIVIELDNSNDVNKRISTIKAAINSGMSFENLVKEFSSSVSKENNGDIGWVQLSQMIPEIRTHLKNVQVGEMTDIINIKKNNTLMIFKVLDKDINKVKKFGPYPTAEEKAEIANFIKTKKISNIVRTYLHQLRNETFVHIF